MRTRVDDYYRPGVALVLSVVVTVLVAAGGWWTEHGSVRYAEVFVRWNSAADADIASRLSLHAAEAETDGTQKYMLTDTSPRNIAAILSNSAIQHVERIDRANLTATSWEEATPSEWLTRRYPTLHARYNSQLTRIVRPVALAPIFLFTLVVSLAATRGGRAWLSSRVPALTPEALGVFRVILALAALPVVVSALSTGWLRIACVALLLAFGAGYASRWTFILFVAAFTFGLGNRINGHDFAQPVRTLWLLTLVPWCDAPPIGARVQHTASEANADECASRTYGLAIWIPMFMLGIAYLAAAFAKLDETGIAWATHGGIRYFLVEEAANAPGRLGRIVASSDTLSVLFSTGALLTEFTIILGALSPKPLVRIISGGAALALHAGFYVLQGIWWPGWWMLLPAFVPWDVVVRRASSRVELVKQPIPRWIAAIILIVALQQPVVSLLKLEYPPLVSNFPMYSDVQWDSKDAYSAFANTIRQPPPQLRIEPLDGSAAELVLKRLGETGGMEEVMKIATGIVADRPISDEDAQKMRDTATVYQKRFGVSPPKMVASIRGWQFDWSRADFTPRADTRQVILDFAAGSIDAAKK